MLMKTKEKASARGNKKKGLAPEGRNGLVWCPILDLTIGETP